MQVDEGNDTAAYNLGMAYLKGQMGLEKNLEEAAALITKSAEAGNAHAKFMLGIFALDGVGREKDLAEARRCFESAAATGVASAQYNLAACLQASPMLSVLCPTSATSGITSACA